MDDQFPKDENSSNADFVVPPESGPGQDAVNFSASAQQEKFLGGSSEKPESEDPGRRFIEVNGIRTSYIERGNPHGVPLMYIGGWASSARGEMVFLDAFEGKIPDSKGLRVLSENKPESAEGIKRMVESLKDKYRVVDLELPGFGKSAPLEGEINLDTMADFVPEFQKAIGMEKPVVFGSSMGGIVATKLASRHPEAVRALFLQGLMTRPDQMDKGAYLAGKVAASWPVRGILKIPGVFNKVFSMAAKTSKDFKMSEKDARDAMVEGAKLAHVKTALSTLPEIGKDIGKDIERVQCPVVIIDGASGDMVPILKSAEVAARFHPEIQSPSEKIAQKKVVYLPIGGKAGEQSHTIVNTLPEGTAAMIDDVLSKIIPQDQKPQA